MKRQILPMVLVLNLIVLVSTGFCETITNSQEILSSKHFSKYIGSKQIRYQLYKFAVHMDQRLGVKSKEEYNVLPGAVGIIKPVEMSAKASYPASGVWKHRYELTRGGKKRTYNLAFAAQKDKAPKPIALIMGTTNASIQLTNDTLPSVFAASNMRKAAKWSEDEYKKNAFISNAKVIKPPHTITSKGKKMHGVWIEEWTVKVLKHEVPIEIMFVPDEKGTGTSFMIIGKKGNKS